MALIPILLASLRLALCFLPQTGYLHPDEMFQSVDIVGGKFFNSKINPAWEFKTDKPVRSMLIPHLLNTIAFKLATKFKEQPSAYVLLVTPRLIYTLISFVVDISLYKVCRYHSSRGQWYVPISVIFQSSFICMGCMTRSLSNNIEVVLFSLLLVIVCRLIRPRFRILFVRPDGRSSPAFERMKSSKQLISSFTLGVILSLGIFNRPTFVCFALAPLMYWLHESFKRNSMNISLTITRALTPMMIAFLLTSIFLSGFDTTYYKSLDVLTSLLESMVKHDYDKSYNLIKTEWVLTPINFIMYNTNVENLSKYGLHAPYFHLLINGPVYFNILMLLFYGKLINLLVGNGMFRMMVATPRVFALMILSTLTPLILFSFVPHQEFRFLIPLIVPLTYAFGPDIYRSNKLFMLWTIVNAILVLFYAGIHQAGVLRSTLHLDPILKSTLGNDYHHQMNIPQINVIAMRCYPVPTYLWNVAKMDERVQFDVTDTFMDFELSLESKLDNLLAFNNGLTNHKRMNLTDKHLTGDSIAPIYLLLPTLYENRVVEILNSYTRIESYDLSTVRHFMPHFSGEDIEMSMALIKKRGLKGMSKAFGFSILNLNLTYISNL